MTTRREAISRLGLIAAGLLAQKDLTQQREKAGEKPGRATDTITISEEELSQFIRNVVSNAEYYSPRALQWYPGWIEWLREQGRPLNSGAKKFITAWQLLGVTV
jgi:hypothetical protein